VMNAGINRGSLFLRMPDKDWDDIMNVNINGLYNVGKPVFQQMMRQRGGSMLAITSISGIRAVPAGVPYAVSKAASIGFIKAVAREGGRLNIRANAIAVGVVDTDLAHTIPEQFLGKYREWCAMERLGHPERTLRFVHIGGTNGKGSTLSFMRSVLQKAGYEVGSFTSPYIERFQNRIQINGQDIADEDLMRTASAIKQVAEELSETDLGQPSEFEVVTAIAIEYFSRIAYPDVVLWEVGLGGRLDSTNVVTPIASVITNIGLDHTEWLGEDLASIAREKAGIIKPGVPVVTAVQDEQALRVIRETAEQKQATLYTQHYAFNAVRKQYDAERQTFDYKSVFSRHDDVAISLQGSHQVQNAGTAIFTLEILKQYYALQWERADLYEGLAETHWAGRMETIRHNPQVILDGAHNPQGIQALAKSLRDYYGERSITLFLSSMRDKEIEQMLASILPVVHRVVLTEFDFPRVMAAEELARKVETVLQHIPVPPAVTVAPVWQEVYKQLSTGGEERDLFVFAGSLYFIADIRKRI
jgi:dihydrofolate synthase / folylpolyglutamate synthase